MSSDATWLRGLKPRLPGVTVGRGPVPRHANDERFLLALGQT